MYRTAEKKNFARRDPLKTQKGRQILELVRTWLLLAASRHILLQLEPQRFTKRDPEAHDHDHGKLTGTGARTFDQTDF